jgi:hypothetical protein
MEKINFYVMFTLYTIRKFSYLLQYFLKLLGWHLHLGFQQRYLNEIYYFRNLT